MRRKLKEVQNRVRGRDYGNWEVTSISLVQCRKGL